MYQPGPRPGGWPLAVREVVFAGWIAQVARRGMHQVLPAALCVWFQKRRERVLPRLLLVLSALLEPGVLKVPQISRLV